MNWTQVAQDRYKWWVIVNTVMMLQVPKYGEFLTACATTNPQERLSTMTQNLKRLCCSRQEEKMLLHINLVGEISGCMGPVKIRLGLPNGRQY